MLKSFLVVEQLPGPPTRRKLPSLWDLHLVRALVAVSVLGVCERFRPKRFNGLKARKAYAVIVSLWVEVLTLHQTPGGLLNLRFLGEASVRRRCGSRGFSALEAGITRSHLERAECAG